MCSGRNSDMQQERHSQSTDNSDMEHEELMRSMIYKVLTRLTI